MVKVIGQNGTIGCLDLKSIDLDTKIVTLFALVKKLWSKMSFLIMVASVTHWFKHIFISSHMERD